jgi:hypothetical protein
VKTKKEKRKDMPEKKPKARNKYVVTAAIGIIIILACAAYYLNQKHATACFSGKCFSLEVARTPDERQYGLMNRESLDPDKGMLFVFEKEGVYPFWMKNTKIPLDQPRKSNSAHQPQYSAVQDKPLSKLRSGKERLVRDRTQRRHRRRGGPFGRGQSHDYVTLVFPRTAANQ